MKGSFQKRSGKKGIVWTCVIDGPPDPVTGKRRQKRLRAPTKEELEALVATMQHELTAGAYVDVSTATLGTYLGTWLEAAEPTLRPSSVRRYYGAIHKQMVPALGTVRLAKLSGIHLQRFYAGRLAAGLSPATVALYHGILHRALEQAVRWRMIARNPCDDVDPPRPVRAEMQTWSIEQTRAFLTGTADDHLAALYRLALTLGLRQGELLALRWDDVDLDQGRLAVRRTLSRGKGGAIIFGEPKSTAGRRAIALPQSCVTALKQHQTAQKRRRLQHGSAWQDTGLVFDRGNGQYLHPNVVRAAFKAHAARLGLPSIRFHDQRHTAATLALVDGQHPKVVQERLGHSDVSMTLNRYSHVTMSMQRDAADRLERLLGS